LIPFLGHADNSYVPEQIKNKTLIIKRILWENPPASSALSIGDPISGNILWNQKSNASGNDVDSGWLVEPELWQDFSIDIMPGGILYIWHKVG